MTFEQKLQNLRKEHGFSQEELAEKLGVSRQAVSKWETGLSYPETEKLIALSKLFDVSLDFFLKEMPEEKPAETQTSSADESDSGNNTYNNPYAEENAVKNKKQNKNSLYKKLLIGLGAAVIILPLIMYLFSFSAAFEITEGFLTAPYNTVVEIKTVTVPEIKTVTVAETITIPQTVTVTETVTIYEEVTVTTPEEPTDTEFSLPQGQELALWVFDFAQRWRLDYMPFFELGNEPTESPEYLFWAFAINLENWGEDKGTMSKAYVEDVVREHFGVPTLSHLSMWKGWDYENGVYTAYPGGLKELPLCALREFKTYYDEYGVALYEITVDFYGKTNGEYESEEDIEYFRSHMTVIEKDKKWRARQSIKLVFSLSGYFEKPRFLECINLTEY